LPPGVRVIADQRFEPSEGHSFAEMVGVHIQIVGQHPEEVAVVFVERQKVVGQFEIVIPRAQSAGFRTTFELLQQKGLAYLIARRFYGQAQADRTEKGTGPQAEEAGEEPETSGKGAEGPSQREEIEKGGTGNELLQVGPKLALRVADMDSKIDIQGPQSVPGTIPFHGADIQKADIIVAVGRWKTPGPAAGFAGIDDPNVFLGFYLMESRENL